MEYLTKIEREELRTLSKEIFGTRSAWQNILRNGILQPFAEPGPIPARAPKYMSVSELKTHMLKLKKELEEFKAKMAAEAAAKAEEEAKKVTEKVEA